MTRQASANYYQKKQRKDFQKVLWKVSKSYRRKKKREHDCERYKNLSEDEKQKLSSFKGMNLVTIFFFQNILK